jgi:type II secretory pathway component PulM
VADPVSDAGAYVAAAYIVFLTLVVVYVAIIGAKVARIERELESLSQLVEEPER